MKRDDVVTRRVSKAGSGANTILTVGASQRLILIKAKINVATSVSGDVVLSVGALEIGGIQNPIPGGNHDVVNNTPGSEMFATGVDLTSTQPDTTNIEWTITYILEDI